MHVTDAQLHDVFTTLEHQLDTLHEDSMGIYTVTDAHAYKADVFWNSRDPEYIELVVYSKTDTAIWYKRDALGNITKPDSMAVLNYMTELVEYLNN